MIFVTSFSKIFNVVKLTICYCSSVKQSLQQSCDGWIFAFRIIKGVKEGTTQITHTFWDAIMFDFL